jgi:phosphoglycolate phosphatase
LGKLEIELLVFDLDGTLIDSKTDIADAVNYALTSLNMPALEHSLIYSYVGNGVIQLLEKVLTNTNKEGDLKETLGIFLERYENHLLDKTRLFPNVMETLEYFSGINMGLISNKPERFVKKIVKGLNIERFFPIVLGGDSLKTKKPEPEGIYKIINAFKAKPGRTLIVGDGGVDIQTGKRVGIRTCGVSYGFRDRKELIDAGADVIIDDIKDLRGRYYWKKEN